MVEAEDKNHPQQIKVSAQGIHISPRKVRQVAGGLRDLPLYHAQDQLNFMVQKSARPLAKLVASGLAAAKNDYKIEPERLYIKSLTVDGGPFFKRYKPRAQGRAFPIRRRSSHISLVLGVSEKPLVSKRTQIAKKPKKKEEPKAPALDPKKLSQKISPKTEDEVGKKKETVSTEPDTDQGKKSWFNFFRGKRGGKSTGRADVKGKKQQQSFDRRGNM